MPPLPPLLYLGPAEVERCALTPAEAAAAVREAFLARSAGQAVTAPNLHLPLPGRKFTAKAALLPPGPGGDALAVLKWYGNVPGNGARGLAEYNPVLLVSDIESGLPLALLDGDWITRARTAALSVTAASVLASAEARRLGIVGCGRQGLAHLEAFAAAWPIEEVTLHSRGAAGVQRLAERAGALGLRVCCTDQPRAAVSGQDIVVSAINRPVGGKPADLLRAEWLSAGGFAAMVDMGVAWVSESMSSFDTLATDELEPGRRRTREALNYTGEFDADLAGLLTQPQLASQKGRLRQAFIFAGAGLADAAVGAAVYRRALERGVGHRLPR